MAHVGHMYANGDGVPQSNVTALRWFKEAAEHAVPSALTGLGYMHLSGYGVAMDHRQAFKYFSDAAEQVHPGTSCPPPLPRGYGHLEIGYTSHW